MGIGIAAIFCSRNRTVAEDMLPCWASISWEVRARDSARPSESAAAENLRAAGVDRPVGDFGEAHAGLGKPCLTPGAKLAVDQRGQFAERVISKPWSPMCQVMASRLSGRRQLAVSKSSQRRGGVGIHIGADNTGRRSVGKEGVGDQFFGVEAVGKVQCGSSTQQTNTSASGWRGRFAGRRRGR